MKTVLPATGAYTDGDIETNNSSNLHISDLIAERYSRRQTLLGGLSAMTTAVFGSALLAGCGDDDVNTTPITVSAGQDVSTTGGRVVTLTASASDNATSTSFTQVSGPTVAVTTSGNSISFTAPNVAASTAFVFEFTASGANGRTSARSTVTVTPATLAFSAVAKNRLDVVTVPEGYSVNVLYRLGDPIAASVAAFANDGTDSNYAQRAGDHHDGMSFFGLSASGSTPDSSNSARGLLVLNHENINQPYLHVNGPTTVNGARPQAEAIKEIEVHGVSVIEVTRSSAGAWSYVQGSALNRRITPNTEMQFSGPVAGNAALKTLFSTDGTKGRGTINNCANGTMPWHTYLTNEENWAGYFRRSVGDATVRNANGNAKQNVSLARYGKTESNSGGNYGWVTVVPDDSTDTRFRKWNITADANLAADGTQDFRNEIFQYGWVVEIDPFNPTSTPRKRTALGRMNHEGCVSGRMVVGVKPAFYMGDDAQGEYLYKFVSNTAWVAADADATDRLATGDKYLNAGTLYVAKFAADGKGTWVPLVFGQNGLTADSTVYPFADQADVLINTRLAADVVGATKMDRPEWTAVNPVNGEVYLTLTNNSTRRPLASGSQTGVDAANPRAYADVRGAASNPTVTAGTTTGNANGHVIRLHETGDTTEATTFAWDIYAFGSGADLDKTNINLSNLDETNDFSSPDGLWFGLPSNASGQIAPLMWLQTDDGAYTDITNCMMLVGMPGQVGDGASRSVTSTVTTAGVAATATVTTYVGAAPGAKLKRFLVGPRECEITGITSTADGKSVFVNIQHPGENGTPANITSNWPASQTSQSASSRPRSATIVITKNDGGVVGL